MFKPLLAPREAPETKPGFFEGLPWPLAVFPKYDGIRALPKEGTVKSRSYKDLPSAQAQRMFSPFQHLDGELIVGSPTDFDVYNRTQSHVMSKDKPAEQLRMFVFDWTLESAANIPYLERYQEARILVNRFNEETGDKRLILAPYKVANNLHEFKEIDSENIAMGFEGSMSRSFRGKYKHGRATYNEGIIYKHKQFTDDEGKVVDFEEAMINLNELEVDELGYAKRSDHQGNKVPAGRVGGFIVEYQGQRITVAPGNFTHAELKFIWEHRSLFVGKYLKFRYFAHGVKDMPRHPRAIGWRDLMDM